MGTLVYRWQDDEGRGPYRPGLSLYWKDADHEARNPSMMDEFGTEFLNERRPGEHLGCAFRSVDQMREWFNDAERERLMVLGYRFGSIRVDRVLRESTRQLVCAARRPLRAGFVVAEGAHA